MVDAPDGVPPLTSPSSSGFCQFYGTPAITMAMWKKKVDR